MIVRHGLTCAAAAAGLLAGRPRSPPPAGGATARPVRRDQAHPRRPPPPVLTLRISAAAGESTPSPAVVSATYRLSTTSRPLSVNDCGGTLATEPGIRGFTNRPQSPAYKVDVPLPLVHYLVCCYTDGYASTGTTSTDPANQGLSDSNLLGFQLTSHASVQFNSYFVSPFESQSCRAWSVAPPPASSLSSSRWAGPGAPSPGQGHPAAVTAVVIARPGASCRAVLSPSPPFAGCDLDGPAAGVGAPPQLGPLASTGLPDARVPLTPVRRRE